MAKKPLQQAECIEVYYDKLHWQRLKILRSEAIKIMEVLEKANLTTICHGSLARGDITVKSDIDIFIPNLSSSFIIELVLGRVDTKINRRLIIQATPFYAIKGYIEIDKQHAVSFPLAKMRGVERDFYRFGGEIDFAMAKVGRRVAGVDKRLMLIEPCDTGHVESSVVGREQETAKLLKISQETVLDRVRALLRRDKIGRTGVFIEKELAADETFEMALKKLAETKPAVRRRLKFRNK